MPKLSRLLAAAARRIAADPRVQARISDVIENDLKPKAQDAWRKNKPKLEAKAAVLHEQIRKKATRENFEKLAHKVRDRLRRTAPRS
jgi:hypothetical protein